MLTLRALDRKLWRDMRRIWAQSLAIAMVLACGVAVLILSFGTLQNLTETRDAYYERNRFADIFAGATRVPDPIVREIARLPGVAQVEPRIADYVVLDMPGMVEPGMGRVISLPPDGALVLNIPLLRTGRLPDPLSADEVAVAQPFAEAHGLRPGDSFRAVMNGQMRELQVAGIVLSPEYIYTIGPASLFPDNRRFGVFWMSHTAAAAAFDLDGAFNDISLRLTPGADAAPVIAALDDMLDPYGGTGAHDRDRQMSHNFLKHELEQLEALAWIMPPIFFVVSAFLVNMVMGRLIALERQQIGLMKAVGYRTREISAHYLKMAAVIGVLGVLIGWAAGIWISDGMTELYAEFFHFPYLVSAPSTAAFAISGVLAVATVVVGAMRAVRGTVRLRPAVAMSPPEPPKFSRGLVDHLGTWLRLRQTTMMILRSITRWPGRAAVTFLGVATSVAVLVGSFFFFDAFDVMMDEMFTQSNRQQMTLNLTREQTLAAVEDATNLPGVLRVEGGYAVQVRLINGPRESLQSLQARPDDAELVRLLDRDSRPVPVSPSGLILPELLADDLGVQAGDVLAVEFLGGHRETHAVPVAQVARQSLGEAAYMRDTALFELLRVAPRVNQLNLLVDEAALPALYAQIKATPAISGVALWSEVRVQYQEMVDETLFTMIFIYTMLGVLIAVGVVYNAARIQLSERAHELASLRVLGFSRGEVSYVLVGEIMLLTLAGLPLGWLAGYGFAAMTSAGLSSEIVNIPLVVSKQTYAWAALVVFVSALGSVLLVRRRLDRVELVSALKQKE
ncbi:ABC transporter permease [Alkalilacustris brevis]|uniref:ABC transporter permease n=1 Tax=Alkalilacustris brevis TaxID=2026338 RepID=UPI001EE3DDFA|nr:ABC transporter permease [Alkalilacustris brevis]